MGWADCQVRIRVCTYTRVSACTVLYVGAYLTYVRRYVRYVRGVLDLNPDPDRQLDFKNRPTDVQTNTCAVYELLHVHLRF